MCKPTNLQRTFRKNLPRAAALLQHRQVNLHARKIHVFLLANGNVIHHLAKERYRSLQTWIWTAKSETHGHFSKFRHHGAMGVPLFTLGFLIALSYVTLRKQQNMITIVVWITTWKSAVNSLNQSAPLWRRDRFHSFWPLRKENRQPPEWCCLKGQRASGATVTARVTK